ncbi:MAG: Flp pilus assembly protein CpaB [Cyanobacteriota bacterium]
MAKINLRNRIRDNNEDDAPQSQTENKQFGFNMDKVQDTVVSYEQPVKQEAYASKQSQPQQQAQPQNNYYQPPVEQKAPPEQMYRQQPQQNNYESKTESIRKKNADIFKESEEESPKGFTGLLKGTKKLFTKKLDGMPMTRNIMEKLNVNKRMLYIALGTSSVAAILVLNYLNGFTKSKLYGSDIVNILVANKDLKEKSLISMADIRVAEIPERYKTPNAIVIKSPDDVKNYVGKVAIVDIGANEQLTERRILSEDKSPWKSPFIPANHRAFDIPTKNMSYIRPNEHVDVLVSVPHPIDRRKMINTPVLQNASVLAVDGKFKITTGDSTPGDNIMIAVPNNLVHLFSLLQERGGNFKVILRKEGDTTNLEQIVSIEKLDLMFSDNSTKIEKVEPLKLDKPKPKPVFVDPVPYNPPAPAYVPPPREYNPPAPAYVAPKKVPKVVEKKPEPPKTTHTVTVINGGDQKQTQVTSKEEEKK